MSNYRFESHGEMRAKAREIEEDKWVQCGSAQWSGPGQYILKYADHPHGYRGYCWFVPIDEEIKELEKSIEQTLQRIELYKGLRDGTLGQKNEDKGL